MKKLPEFIEWLHLNYEQEATRKIYSKNVYAYFKNNDMFNQESLNAYFKTLSVANSTHALIINSLKIYQKFLLNFNKEKLDIEYPRLRKATTSDPKFITEEELEEILEKIPVVFQEYDKARAVLALMFYTGMRPKEIVSLTRDEFMLSSCTIELNDTKTHHDRIIPFPKLLLDSISSYFNRTLEVSNAFNITDRYLQYICIKVKENFALRYFSPYVLRHSYAKWFLKRTHNDHNGLQKLMGHSDIKTTLGYTKQSNDEAIESYRNIFNKRKGKKK